MPRTRSIGVIMVLLAACTPADEERVATAASGGLVAFVVPHDSTMPDGPMGISIRRGRALLEHTRDSLPDYVGNRLACTSCHPAAGTKQGAMPWLGVYGQFPQYRSRSATVQVIEDRIDDCFLRSMNGRMLPRDGRDLRDIIAYMSFLSRDIPVGARVEGQALPRFELLQGDTLAGASLWAAECARCHGTNGEGGVGPPVWGDSSFNIGAGMARLRTAAAFIRHNMPLDKPGTLTDQQAADVAAYITSRPRPDFPGKEHDWPRGDPPPDVAYATLAADSAAAAAGAQ